MPSPRRVRNRATCKLVDIKSPIGKAILAERKGTRCDNRKKPAIADQIEGLLKIMINRHDNWIDNWMNDIDTYTNKKYAPSLLTLGDVRQIAKGKKVMWVVEPPLYNEVTLLTEKDDLFKVKSNPPLEVDLFKVKSNPPLEVGAFYVPTDVARVSSNVDKEAVFTGSGSYEYWVVDEKLLEFLQRADLLSLSPFYKKHLKKVGVTGIKLEGDTLKALRQYAGAANDALRKKGYYIGQDGSLLALRKLKESPRPK